MKQTKNFLLPTILLVCVPAMGGGSSSSGCENPAVTQCVNLGGNILIFKDSENGEGGYCQFDKATIDEWTFYRATSGEQTLATTTFLNHPLEATLPSPTDGELSSANPASVYCGKVGGKTEIWTFNGGQTGMCKFSDRSIIEEWTLYLGPHSPGNTNLASILQRKHQ